MWRAHISIALFCHARRRDRVIFVKARRVPLPPGLAKLPALAPTRCERRTLHSYDPSFLWAPMIVSTQASERQHPGWGLCRIWTRREIANLTSQMECDPIRERRVCARLCTDRFPDNQRVRQHRHFCAFSEGIRREYSLTRDAERHRFQKGKHATKQDRPDVARRRARWKKYLSQLDPTCRSSRRQARKTSVSAANLITPHASSREAHGTAS
jgi:hypothetical protein